MRVSAELLTDRRNEPVPGAPWVVTGDCPICCQMSATPALIQPGKTGLVKIVCLCGSTRYKSEFLEAQAAETLQGRVVLGPGVFSKVDGLTLSDEETVRLHDLHRRKIEMSDELLVVAPDGRIGESASLEIEYGESLGKTIRIWNPVGPD